MTVIFMLPIIPGALPADLPTLAVQRATAGRGSRSGPGQVAGPRDESPTTAKPAPADSRPLMNPLDQMPSLCMPARRPVASATLLALCALVAACGGGSDAPAPQAEISSASAPIPADAASAASVADVPADAASAASAPDATASASPAPDAAASASAAQDATPTRAAPVAQALPVPNSQLLMWNRDWPLQHEAQPLGVPAGYDWYTRGRIGSGNSVPNGFSAMIGWGQVLWGKNGSSGQATIELRNLHTYVCAGSSRRWTRLPGAEVTGAVFRPDYTDNVATPPLASSVENGVSRVTFAAGGAYHFWPTIGRASIPAGPLCGVLVMLEARRIADPNGTGNLIVGLGGDYWMDKTAAWDQYKTNSDIGIGRMKLMNTSWRWYAMSTASDADLLRLNSEGFAPASQ
jgi:hypothetical protein